MTLIQLTFNLTLRNSIVTTQSQDVDFTDEGGMENLPKLISKLIEKEEKDLPSWIKNEIKITKNSSTADEMRSHLRHIVLPHSLHSYEQLRTELLKIDAKNDSKNDSKNNDKNNEKNDFINEKEIETVKIESTENSVEKPAIIELSSDLNMLSSISSITTADKKNIKKVRDFFCKIKSGSEEGKNKSQKIKRQMFMCYNLIQLEFIFPVVFFSPLWLLFFIENKITNHQIVHFCTHKAFISIFGRTNDRFATYIETGIYNQTITCLFLKFINQSPVFWIGFLVNGLNTSREINVCY